MSWDQALAHQAKHGFLLDKAVPQGQTPVSPNIVIKRGNVPNKTESEFGLMLEAQYRAGEFLTPPKFEAIKLKVGERCYYCPDWMITRAAFGERTRPVVMFFEVKGAHTWEDSVVKFKAAKEQYPFFEFELHRKKQGSWTRIL
jgi:hypothetical protein